MKICLDISPAVYRRAGIGRYTRELTSALLDLGGEDEYVGFYNRASGANLDGCFSEMTHLTRDLPDKPWRLSVLTAHFLGISQDRWMPGIHIFHATDNLLPLLSEVKSVFTLHDLAFRHHPETHTCLNRLFLRTMMPWFLRKADTVVADSESTRRDALKFYKLKQSKIRVIYPGVHPRFRPVHDLERLAAVRRRYALPARFLLFVGSIEPRKNLETLLEVFRNLRPDEVRLVIAGERGWRYRTTLECLQSSDLRRKLILTGFVPDDDLPVLYSLAEAFVYPSLYEGFGLPVLEAMACGTPVITSNSSSLPEVASDAAIMVAPRDVRGWLRALDQIIQNSVLKAELRQRGLRRARGFSWESTACKMRKVYQEVYGHCN
ncbi:MAG: glycosyltransferase family 4 protein [Desulfobacterales bacterium]|nr:MAG: glycosyltransferase family 4 protein [Desulfobacterales bacterium]